MKYILIILVFGCVLSCTASKSRSYHGNDLFYNLPAEQIVMHLPFKVTKDLTITNVNEIVAVKALYTDQITVWVKNPRLIVFMDSSWNIRMVDNDSPQMIK